MITRMRSGRCSDREKLQHTDDRNRRHRREDRRRKTEGRKQRTKGGGQMVEDGGIGIRISECGLRPVGAIGACAPEGMRNDGIALLSLFLCPNKDPQEWTPKFKTDRFVVTYQ